MHFKSDLKVEFRITLWPVWLNGFKFEWKPVTHAADLRQDTEPATGDDKLFYSLLILLSRLGLYFINLESVDEWFKVKWSRKDFRLLGFL